MKITPFEPWTLVNMLHRDLDQIGGRRYGLAQGDEAANSVADWIPATDIVEEQDRFVLRADLPGVDPENIDVNMENGILTLTGERSSASEDETNGLRRIERASGRFYRRFTLPETADAEGITAKSANGILELVIPKQPEVRARRITVEAA